jgi:hypothetical protein
MLARMVRATLLDVSIYRQVAFTPALQSEAYKVAALVIAFSSFGYLIFSLLSGGLPSINFLITTFVIQAIAWFARVGAVSLALSGWLKQPVEFNVLFRTMTYAQSPWALRFVPVVGQLVDLWTLVTGTAALRDVTGRTPLYALILTIVGYVGGSVAAAVATNLLRTFYF